MNLSRCHKCAACKKVNERKPEFFPALLTDTRSDRTRAWNQILADNPCEGWSDAMRQGFYKILKSCHYFIRPRRIPVR